MYPSPIYWLLIFQTAVKKLPQGIAGFSVVCRLVIVETAVPKKEAGRANYEVTAEETISCNGQSYTLLTYHFTSEENPYSHGVSAFGVFENSAICVELTCQESYGEDLHEMLTGFLEGFDYK